MKIDNQTYVSLADIEQRAHQLRAEAARDMSKAFGAWLRGFVFGKSAGVAVHG